jgi:hypothetical protein
MQLTVNVTSQSDMLIGVSHMAWADSTPADCLKVLPMLRAHPCDYSDTAYTSL